MTNAAPQTLMGRNEFYDLEDSASVEEVVKALLNYWKDIKNLEIDISIEERFQMIAEWKIFWVDAHYDYDIAVTKRSIEFTRSMFASLDNLIDQLSKKEKAK